MSAPLPNPARGETAITLGDQSFTVRPTFQALVAAEQDVGPLFALVEKAATGHLTLVDTVSLIWHCLHDKPDQMTREALGELIAETGIGMLSPLLQRLLGQIIKGR